MDQLALKREVRFQSALSRGPGGQNVNRTASAALLTWDFEKSNLLTAEQKARIRYKLGSMINSKGEIYLRSDEFRDLERNKARSIEKLQRKIAEALHVPKKRIKTKPTKASKIKRREEKKRRSEIKKLRRSPW